MPACMSEIFHCVASWVETCGKRPPLFANADPLQGVAFGSRTGQKSMVSKGITLRLASISASISASVLAPPPWWSYRL